MADVDAVHRAVEVGAAIGATLGAKFLWGWIRAPWRAQRTAEAAHRLASDPGRRSDDRYVLKEVCVKCQELHGASLDALVRSLSEFRQEWARDRQVIFDLLKPLPDLAAKVEVLLHREE